MTRLAELVTYAIAIVITASIATELTKMDAGEAGKHYNVMMQRIEQCEHESSRKYTKEVRCVLVAVPDWEVSDD